MQFNRDLKRHASTAAVVCSLALASTGALAADGYNQLNLVTDDQAVLTGLGYSPAATVDRSLVNPWGIAFVPQFHSPFWTSNNGTNTTTLYDGHGIKQPLTVAVTGGPTGQVNGGFNFKQPSEANASLFIFSSEGGTISSWNTDGVSFPLAASVAVNNAGTGAVYKGLAEATVNGTHHQLYATDFHNGRIDVFNSSFGSVVNPTGAFTDPDLPTGYAPFGIQNINGDLYVTYAKQNAARHDDRAGPGNGVVDVFGADGTLLARVASRGGVLNSPWGVALAPSDFGQFAGDLLIGNFGDGLINVFDPHTFNYVAHLSDANGDAIQIDGLWALTFGKDAKNGIANGLYFTAGIAGEAHGLFGALTPVPVPGSLPLLGGALLWLAARRRTTSNTHA